MKLSDECCAGSLLQTLVSSELAAIRRLDAVEVPRILMQVLKPIFLRSTAAFIPGWIFRVVILSSPVAHKDFSLRVTPVAKSCRCVPDFIV